MGLFLVNNNYIRTASKLVPLHHSIFSLNADILKSNSDILDVVSRHLFGQLRCLVEVDDVEIAKRWKVCLVTVICTLIILQNEYRLVLSL